MDSDSLGLAQSCTCAHIRAHQNTRDSRSLIAAQRSTALALLFHPFCHTIRDRISFLAFFSIQIAPSFASLDKLLEGLSASILSYTYTARDRGQPRMVARLDSIHDSRFSILDSRIVFTEHVPIDRHGTLI